MDRGHIERLYREEYGRVLATLIKLLGDFELAEEAAQDAFATAVDRWAAEGLPRNPVAWIISVARNKAIDRIRRRDWFNSRREEISRELEEERAMVPEPSDDSDISDERLRLIFTCCHPALNREAQVALSLRTLCGLTSEEIARAFLIPVPTIAQRLVRAKRKILAAKIPYEIPGREQIADRLETVMAVIYLVFNEGYLATAGDALVRADLCREAIRLGRMVYKLMPSEAEPRALLALMLLHDARRAVRTDANGDLVLLEDQDRSRWDRDQLNEGIALAELASGEGEQGFYGLQAAIAAEHGRAERASDTDWARISQLYNRLFTISPTPIIELNLAVAVSMARGPAAGLELLDEIERRGDLPDYYLFWSARADLHRRLGRGTEAAECYRRAIALVSTVPERRFLEKRLAQVQN